MKVTLFISVLFLFGHFNAQNNSKFMCLVSGCEETIDTTTIENIHRYNGDLAYLSIGNIGLTGYNLLFDIGDHAQFKWSRLIGSKSYLPVEYDVKRPYTKVDFVLGSKQEQILRILHTQNISKQANFSFGYDKIKSSGFYLNQASNNNHFYANTWFKTKKEAYKISLNFDHERIFNEHNGGIIADSLFEQDLLLNRNRELLLVNLPEASSTIKRTQLNLDQSFNFFQSLDSLGKGTTHGLVLNVNASKNYRVFKDSLLNTDFYENIFLDTNSTYDEVLYNTIEGAFGYRLKLDQSSKITFFPYFKMQITDYKQSEIDTNYLNQNIGIDFRIEKNKFSFKTTGEYYLGGYRKSNLEATVKIAYNIRPNWAFETVSFYNSISPSLDLLAYSGNNVNWSQTLTTTEHLSISGALISEKYKTSLRFNYNNVFNPVFMNSIEIPQQAEGVSQVIQVSAQKEFNFGKWVIKPKAVYQYQGGYTIYRLPEYYTDLTLGYKTSLFNNNLHLFVGADIVYYAPISAMGFSPMTNQYYLDDSKTIGNYPFIDVFFNARIKSVRFFAKVSHANSGLMGYTYYGATGYPLKDRAIQFGLNWNFLN